MSAKPTIYFHLGLAKTGSTFLQLNVFPYLEGLKFYKKHEHRHYQKHITKNPQIKQFLFSVEENSYLYQRMEEIAKFDPDIRVILVFRKHESWVISKYKYYIRKTGYASFDDFLHINHPNALGWIEAMSYRKKIEMAEKLFNHPPIVWIFDELKSDVEGFMNKITRSTHSKLKPQAPIHQRVKVTYSDKQTLWLRKYNSVVKFKKIKTAIKPLNQLHHKFFQLGVHTTAAIAGIFPNSWLENEVLIPKASLEKIREESEEDWQFCLDYAAKQWAKITSS